VKAVFGWPAIHIRDRVKEETPKLENLFLDCGCKSKSEVQKLGVEVGCVVTFEDELMELNTQYFAGRALDNRMGGFIIAEVARMIKEKKKKLPFGLYVVNSVQEEIGLRGAQMIARRIKPNVAIITDVTHDTQAPMHKKETHGDISLGKGPALTYGSAVQNNLLEMILSVAKKKKISIQKETSSSTTGTDTDAFAYAGVGSASALISLPLRYMHTTVEMVSRKDIENVISLIYEFLIQLKSGYDFRYMK
jgi:putative aminopeptidase FrvX